MKTKNTARFILLTLTLSAILLSACSAAPAIGGDNSNGNGSPVTPIIVDNGNNSNSNDVNSNDSGVEIVSVVEAITGDTITINEVPINCRALQSSKISFQLETRSRSM